MLDKPHDFYQSLPVLTDFAAAVKPQNYRPVPDDWVVGFSDVVGSTRAIAEGRYKAVNFVGAGVIAAVSNALEPPPFSVRLRRRRGELRRRRSGRRRRRGRARTDRRLRPRRVRPRTARGDRSGRDGPRRRSRRPGRPLRRLQACVYAMFAGGGLQLVRGAGEGRRLRGPAAPPDARPGPLRPLLPVGRRAGEARRRPLADRRSARRGSALRGADRGDRRAGVEGAQSGRPVTVDRLERRLAGDGHRARGFRDQGVRRGSRSRRG